MKTQSNACLAVVLALTFWPRPAVALNDGLADRPPMGWNCYHWFGTTPNETMIQKAADGIVLSGLKEAGYVYVNFDDGWMAPARDERNNLVANPTRFPSGLKALTDALHARGLKAGIYLTCGLKTYQNQPGSLDHETQDAAQIAAWGFDFLKYDYRTLPEDPPRNAKAEMIAMSVALRKTGRPIIYSMCEHGRSQPWTWAAEYAHLWRISTDIKDCRDGEFEGGWGFDKIVDDQDAALAASAGPGHWNDPDMLIVGLHGRQYWMGKGCTDTEYRAHFSLWCLLAAPLILGVDPSDMSPETKAIVMNRELIAVDQDALGRQAQRVGPAAGQQDVWVKPLHARAWAVGLYNRADVPTDIAIHWSELGLPATTRAQVRDLWAKTDLGVQTGQVTRTVAAHECIVLKIGLE